MINASQGRCAFYCAIHLSNLYVGDHNCQPWNTLHTWNPWGNSTETLASIQGLSNPAGVSEFVFLGALRKMFIAVCSEMGLFTHLPNHHQQSSTSQETWRFRGPGHIAGWHFLCLGNGHHSVSKSYGAGLRVTCFVLCQIWENFFCGNGRRQCRIRYP